MLTTASNEQRVIPIQSRCKTQSPCGVEDVFMQQKCSDCMQIDQAVEHAESYLAASTSALILRRSCSKRCLDVVTDRCSSSMRLSSTLSRLLVAFCSSSAWPPASLECLACIIRRQVMIGQMHGHTVYRYKQGRNTNLAAIQHKWDFICTQGNTYTESRDFKSMV